MLSNIHASGNLPVSVGTVGTLHKPGETNDIGLVMFGEVERAPQRFVAPSGTNREYAYWRGNQNKETIEKFDQAYMALEGSGIYGSTPQVIVETGDSSGSGNCSEGQGQGGCTWFWDLYSGGWISYGNMCPDGCGCGSPPSYNGSTYGEITNTDCTGSTTTQTGQGVGDDVGYARWFKAGETKDYLGDEAITQRSLYLSERSFINVGSGVDIGQTSGYTAFAKFVPSGDMSNTVLVSQHKENPALFVLGCDFDGKFYIRSDSSSTELGRDNIAQFAKSRETYEQYKYPVHLMGVYASGDSRLKLYVNGKLEGESETFTRITNKSANTNMILGKREFAMTQRGFTGWIDEIGVSSRSLDSTEVQSFYDSTFSISDLIFNADVTPTGGALEGTAFGDSGIDAFNETYAELHIESGNPYNAKGGAYDLKSWGGTNNAVSSVLTFDLTQIDPRFHQLEALSVDMWVEHNTTHPSGADVSVVVENQETPNVNLAWAASGINVPSGQKRLISFNKPLSQNLYTKTGKESYNLSLDRHKLKIIVSYPALDSLYNAEFRIFSSKLMYDGFDILSKYNSKDGLSIGPTIYGHGVLDEDGYYASYDTGDKSLTFFTEGGTPTAASGNLALFVDADTAAQSLNLVLNHDPQTSLGNSATGSLEANAGVTMNTTLGLFTKFGPASGNLNLFLKQKEFRKAVPGTLNFDITGSEFVYPYNQKNMPLFLLSSAGTGIHAAEMFLTMPKTTAPPIFDKRLLFIEGRQPVADIPLWIQTASGINRFSTLYVLAPNAASTNTNMNLFLKDKNIFSTSSLKANAGIVMSGVPPLFVSGLGLGSGLLNLSIPNTIGSGTSNTTLTTKGIF